MIANALRLEIERYAARMPTSNPLFMKAEDGTFTPACMVNYLANVRHLSCEAQLYLSQAGQRASERGDEALAKHYAHKRHEELGHEVWADRDIARITAKASTPAPHGVLPSIQALIAFLGKVVDEDPSLYLSYTLFAEYLIVLLGTEWLMLLEERCGIPRSSMTIIGNHIELDREHVEEAFDEIDALVGDPRKLARMREVLEETLAHFDRFCAEVTVDSSASAWTSRDALRNVSAA
jgi:hypothetical protein